MRVLVTGATGFIGTHLVPELLDAGHEVRVLARASSDLSGLPEGVQASRAGLEGAAEAMAGIEGLVHLAGVGGGLLARGDDEGEELRRVNVDGTRQVLEAARDAGVRRAVHVTSMWTVLRPELAGRSPYIRSRLDSEHAALAVRGLDTVLVCPTFVVGPGDRGPNLPGALVLAALRHRLPLALPGGMTWIAVQDVARQLVAALERGVPGERYLLGGEHLAWRDLFAAVGGAAGRPSPGAVLPRPVARLAAGAGDAALALACKRAPIPLRDGVDLLCLDAPVDCSEANRALGAPRVPVSAAVGQAVDWFTAQGRASA